MAPLSGLIERHNSLNFYYGYMFYIYTLNITNYAICHNRFIGKYQQTPC